MVGTVTQPVTLILGPATYSCVGSTYCITVQGTASKVLGQGSGDGSSVATVLQPSAGFTGNDVIHVEAASPNKFIKAVELANFRIELSLAPNVTGINMLSVRDPSHLHDIEIVNGLALAINIGTSATTSAEISQGIGLDNIYIQTAGCTVGPPPVCPDLTNHTVVNTGSQVMFGPNVKIINNTTKKPTAYSGLVIEQDALGGVGFANDVFGTSIAGYYDCALLTNLLVTVMSGPGGNVMGPGNTFEHCTTGVVLDGLNSTTQSTTKNFVFGNFYPTTTNAVYLNFASDNFVWEATNGNSGTITLTSNSAGNNVVNRDAAAGAIADSGTGNWIVHDLLNNTNSNAEFHNGAIYPGANVFFVASDYTTDGTTNAQTPTGLTIPLPALVATTVSIDCHLVYSQSLVPAALDTFYIKFPLAPTNAIFDAMLETNTNAFIAGQFSANTAATATLVQGTPFASGHKYNLDVHGVIENASQAQNNIQLQVSTPTGADTITIYRDSYCKLF